MTSEEFICDIIRDKLRINKTNIKYTYKDSALVEKDVQDFEENRDLLFNEIEDKRSRGLHKDFKIGGLDPVNIQKIEKEILHLYFLKLRISEEERIIKGPVEMTLGEHFFDGKKIEKKYPWKKSEKGKTLTGVNH